MAEDPVTPPAVDPPVTDPPVDPPATPPARPDWCEEKFWDAEKGAVNAEALAQSHKDARRRITELTTPPPKPAAGELAVTPAPPTTLSADAGVDQVIVAAGLDPAALGQQWAEKGTLDQEAYQKLEAVGYPPGVVNQFLELTARDQKHRSAQVNSTAEAAAGGKDKLANLLAWAGAAVSPEEAALFTADINNPLKTKDTVNALLARHAEAVKAGKANVLIEGEGVAAGVEPYTTQAQIIAAENSNEVRTDPKARAAHNQRLMASPDPATLPRR